MKFSKFTWNLGFKKVTKNPLRSFSNKVFEMIQVLTIFLCQLLSSLNYISHSSGHVTFIFYIELYAVMNQIFAIYLKITNNVIDIIIIYNVCGCVYIFKYIFFWYNDYNII